MEDNIVEEDGVEDIDWHGVKEDYQRRDEPEARLKKVCVTLKKHLTRCMGYCIYWIMMINQQTTEDTMKPSIHRSTRRSTMTNLDPVSVSSYGPTAGATFTGRDAKGIAVSVHVPQYILDAMLAAQTEVSNSSKAWHCEPVTEEGSLA